MAEGGQFWIAAGGQFSSAENNCSWQDTAIGSLAVGSAIYNTCDPVTVDISTLANPFSPTVDEQYYVYRELCGDGELIVELTTATPASSISYGIEFRSGIEPGAMKFGLKRAGSSRIKQMERSVLNGAVTVTYTGDFTNYWLKIVRSGDLFTSYVSTDGVTWTQSHTAMALLHE